MRLITRSDFDSLVCAVLLVEKAVVDQYMFVHPREVQHGNVQVSANDVLANVPYAPGCGLWFDHHTSEEARLNLKNLDFEGACKPEPSAAQVIWDYYGGQKAFKASLNPLLEAANKIDSAALSDTEILNPEGWILLAFVIDPGTGLERFEGFRLSNQKFMEDLIQHCRTKGVEEILELPDVQERKRRYLEHQKPFVEMLGRCCEVRGNVIVTNLLNEDVVYCGNRFLVYGLHRDQNIEIRARWDEDKQNVILGAGHSVLTRTSKTDVGKLMLAYGGGGHRKVGTCRVPKETWEAVLEELVARMQKNG